jgi:predicted AlkP superfamily pyrophosphatase or phosphodiesterase
MRFTKFIIIYLLCIFGTNTHIVHAQKRSKENAKVSTSNLVASNPKLVVGIVVDQMRYDYLTRFWADYGDGGFKRMIFDGFNCKNNHFNYAPTSTGPGHASVYTGSAPATHGIIGNEWYDKRSEAMVYCAGDNNYKSVGTETDAGNMSPHRMQVTTITDQLRLHTQMRGKVIAISLKDRGSVLPGGHTANAAYWFHGSDKGHWITSTYYMDKLPAWVNKYNASDAVESYKKPWNTKKNIAEYQESGPDNNAFEGLFTGEQVPVFPHNLPALWNNNGQFEILKVTPYGNNITTDFAIETINQEDLGADSDTDFLAISYSSTDYMGHFFGVNSKEVQDAYVRLDEDITRLLATLDKKVGAGEYTVFLTSDHGAIDVPAYLQSHRIPADYMESASIFTDFNEFLKYKYGTTEIVKNNSNQQLFLDHKIIKNLDLSVQEVQESLASELLQYKAIDRTFTAYQMQNNEYSRGIAYILQNGYNQKRSGDILMVLKPGTIRYPKTGSTHGSPQIYDTHVPLIFYGNGIRRGSTSERTEIPDIAPTLAVLLGIQFPNGSTGTPLVKVLK